MLTRLECKKSLTACCTQALNCLKLKSVKKDEALTFGVPIGLMPIGHCQLHAAFNQTHQGGEIGQQQVSKESTTRRANKETAGELAPALAAF
jgi:hypothetical protein